MTLWIENDEYQGYYQDLAKQMANNLLCGLTIEEAFGDLYEGPGLTDYMCAINDCKKILENRGEHKIANEVHMYLYEQGKRLSGV